MISELPALGVRFTISNASGCIAYVTSFAFEYPCDVLMKQRYLDMAH